MVFQAVRTRFPLRIAAGMTELGPLQEPLMIADNPWQILYGTESNPYR
jgi:hypothetical protein